MAAISRSIVVFPGVASSAALIKFPASLLSTFPILNNIASRIVQLSRLISTGYPVRLQSSASPKCHGIRSLGAFDVLFQIIRFGDLCQLDHGLDSVAIEQKEEPSACILESFPTCGFEERPVAITRDVPEMIGQYRPEVESCIKIALSIISIGSPLLIYGPFDQLLGVQSASFS